MLDVGIHDMPAERYHADPCPQPSLSNSIAKVLTQQSPLHAWHAHPRLNPNYEPDHDSKLDYGSAAHQLLLERRSDAIVIVEADDWRTKAAREARDAARAEGKFPILAYQYQRAKKMVWAALDFISTTELAGIFATGMPERTMIWQESSIWCRCRPDLMSSDYRVCLDYKSTENAEPEAFIRQIGRMSYDLQAEFYCRGITTVTDVQPIFVFLAQEVIAPYACSLIALSNAYRVVGQQKVNMAINTWRQCVVSQKWPSYTEKICYAEPPVWALAEMEAAESEGGKDE